MQLCRRIAERGIDVHVITTQGCSIAVGAPMQVYPIMKRWSWVDGMRLCRFVSRHQPAAVLLIYSGWIYNDEPMITFAPTFIKRLNGNRPFVTQMEIELISPWGTLPKRVGRKLAHYAAGRAGVDYGFGTLLRDSDTVIALSQAHLEHFASSYPLVAKKSIVIPPPPLLQIAPARNGQTREQGRRKLGVSPSDFLLAFFGYADNNKGIDTLFQALHLVRAHHDQVRLVMIGGGRGTAERTQTQELARVGRYEDELHQLPRQLGIEDAVTWLPGYSWDSDEASMFLRAADACVLPFHQGVTMNRSTLAAAASHELPVVTTQAGPVESPLVDGENLLLCPARNPRALAEAITALIHSPDLRKKLALGASRLALRWFSWDRAVAETVGSLQGKEASLSRRI
jgi:glycosyltransferase involved in cell wall biosynthesis